MRVKEGSSPAVLLGQDPDPNDRVRVAHTAAAWRLVGWFGLLLALAGLGDWLIAWIPFQLGSVEWEFGTIVSSMSGLPLVTIGLAAVLASSIARAVRWQIITTAVIILLLAAWILAASVLFLLDVPIALRAVQGIAQLGIVKAIAKTGLLAVLFLAGYILAGVAALRFAKRLNGR